MSTDHAEWAHGFIDPLQQPGSAPAILQSEQYGKLLFTLLMCPGLS